MSAIKVSRFKAVTFSGCGALNFYQTGVGFGLQRAGLIPELSFAGASAGAGLAMGLAGGLDARDIAAQMIEITGAYGEGRILKPAWAYEVAQEFCRRFVTPQTYNKAKDRIAISVTCAWPTRPWLVSQFENMEDMADALTASCFLPHRAQQTHTFRGLPCIDGGFSNNQPVIGKHCLKVSPFWFHAGSHIKPNIRVRPDYAMRVPSERRAWWLFNRGAEDFERFAKRESASRSSIVQSILERVPSSPWPIPKTAWPLKSMLKLNRS